MNIKAVLFDLGNVLTDVDNMETCRNLAPFSHLSPEKIWDTIFESEYEQYDKGMITSQEFYNAVKERISANPALTMERFVDAWNNIFTPNPEIGQVLSRINPGIRLVLISNTNDLHWQHLSRDPIIRQFFGDQERVALSFQEHSRKPDPQFFRVGIEKCQCKPQEIFFIDDIAENVEAFKNLEGNAIVWNCQADSIEKLLRALEEHHVFS